MNTATAKKQETTKRKPAKRHTDAVGAFSIADFCKAHGGISAAFFHKLIGEGRGPKLMKVGARTLISVEAAAKWRQAREREAETAAKRQTESARKTAASVDISAT